jgi:hypothetical protein
MDDEESGDDEDGEDGENASGDDAEEDDEEDEAPAAKKAEEPFQFKIAAAPAKGTPAEPAPKPTEDLFAQQPRRNQASAAARAAFVSWRWPLTRTLRAGPEEAAEEAEEGTATLRHAQRRGHDR